MPKRKPTAIPADDTPLSTIRVPRQPTYACLKILALQRYGKADVARLVTDVFFPGGVPDPNDLIALGEIGHALPVDVGRPLNPKPNNPEPGFARALKETPQ